MLHFLSLKVVVIAVALTSFSLCPPTRLSGSSAVSASAVAEQLSAQTSTVLDPLGDTLFPFNAPFQDFVRGEMTKMANGDFELLMEMAGSVPANPPPSPQGSSEMWWFWIFDLDPTTLPHGYPWHDAVGRPPEFLVCVRWNGTTFAGTAIDRRPLLTGGEAILTAVPFSINGTIVKCDLASDLIGDVPPSFHWGAFTMNWSGPVGSEGCNFADYCEARPVFNP
jgi:hypothetical protein